ncbi:hypothetical protein [Microcoleus sp.]|uniref:hypothetical protein n=1 Tax=Microcoleus sp. TaxID=44472 RepID=UPI003593D8A4
MIANPCFLLLLESVLCHQGGQCFVTDTLRSRTIDRQSIDWLTGEKVLTVDIVIAVVIFGLEKLSVGFWIKPVIWFDDLPFD